MRDPITEIDTRYSSQGVSPMEWSVAVAGLERAEIYWISTATLAAQSRLVAV